ncbi:MAG: M24 family metallopeptidase [Candidatus Margulisiibacteriota bacterium]
MNSKKISRIRSAAKIASSLIEDVRLFIRPGLRECDISSFIRKRIKFYGADGESFKTIVAAGKRSAMPHGYATKNRIRKNDVVMVDCGVKYKGVCSDITRMIFIGDGGAGFKTKNANISKIYNIVKSAQTKAIRLVRSGVSVRKIDLAVRKEFKKYGLEKYFPHSTGHGICEFVHEEPKIYHKKSDILEAGTVITIEPGLYFPNLKKPFGMRVEDMVLVKKNGCEILTTAGK